MGHFKKYSGQSPITNYLYRISRIRFRHEGFLFRAHYLIPFDMNLTFTNNCFWHSFHHWFSFLSSTCSSCTFFITEAQKINILLISYNTLWTMAYPSLFSDTLQGPRPLPVPVQYSSPTSSHPKAIPTCPHSGKERWVSFASLTQSRLEPWGQVARGGGSKMAAGRNQAAKPRMEKRLRSQLSGRMGTIRRSPPALKGISPELLTCCGWCWTPLHLRARGGGHSSDGHENNPWRS